MTRAAAPPSKRRSRLRKTLYALLASLVFLTATEAALRLFFALGRRVALPDEEVFNHANNGFAWDPDLLWYWQELPLKPLDINLWGFRRSKPMTRQKAPGTLRVVTLGDSQTFGAGLEVDQTYSAVAEELLGPPFEVLNAGLSGYKSLNVYRLLRKRIILFDPDVVVVDCATGDSPEDRPAPLRPSLGEGLPPLQAILWESAIYHGLQLAFSALRDPGPAELDVNAVKGDGWSTHSGWTGNHRRIEEWGEAMGIRVLFLDYPFWNERHDGRLLCLQRPEYLPESAIVVPACDALARSGLPPSELFFDGNHLNARGARVVAEVLARTLRESYGMPPRPATEPP